MSGDIPKIADAVLYEGHLLYPYRPSALKNQHRYPFGTLYPRSFCETHGAGDEYAMRLECLLLGPGAEPALRLRFLQGDQVREVHGTGVFEFAPVRGRVAMFAAELRPQVRKLVVDVTNECEPNAAFATRDAALHHAIVSPHLLLFAAAGSGQFASLIDPPPELSELAAGCKSRGTWPVLLGTPGTNVSDRLLSAPIILYDYPRVAPESPGDFFDGTEIDELLTLRLLTLSDDEKREIRASGGAGKSLLERTEALGIGATVRLHPSCRADILDLALAGREATIRAVERDYEGRTYLAVTLNDDPGQDLGIFGHRFFMRPDEVEPV